MYTELTWSAQTRPNGTDNMRVLHRHFFDLLDARGAARLTSGNDATVIGALIAVAALLLIALAAVLLIVRRRKRRFQRL
jgi:nitrate reductase gamma subunit